MSLWEELGGRDAIAPLAGTACRLVESQEQVATTHLVDSLSKQALLEEMLEQTKPPVPEAAAQLDYLLATPFRYPPLRHGSRFGQRTEPGIFYASKREATVLAEAAYYRLVFWEGMTQPPQGKFVTQHTLFGVRYRTARGVRLQAPPWDRHAPLLAHPSDYRVTQELGAAMRSAGVDAFEYTSARDPEKGVNVGLFSPAAFSSRAPSYARHWLCETTGAGVRFYSSHNGKLHQFPRELFLVDGQLPRPAF